MLNTRTTARRFALVAAASALAATGSNDVSAANFSFTGSFDVANRVRLFSFTLGSTQTVDLLTLSASGGTNSAGTFIPSGSFDPILSLFGPGGALITQDDDGGSGLDSRINTSLSAGTYTLALTRFSNFARGPALSNGWNNNTGNVAMGGAFANWAVDIRNVSSASSAGQTLAANGGNWNNATGAGNQWHTGSNWSTGGAPNSVSDALFALPSTYAVEMNPSAAHFANNLYADAGTVTFNLNSGTLYTNANFAAGQSGGTTASVVLNGSGTVNVGGRFQAGNQGNGSITIQNGADVVASDHVILADANGASGELTVTGNGSTVTTNATVGVGGDGRASGPGSHLRVLQGGSVTGGAITLISRPGQPAALATVSSTTAFASKLISTGDLTVGNNTGGAGALAVSSGGSVSVAGTTTVGSTPGSVINLTAGTLKTGSLYLGDAAQLNWTAGTLHLDGGTADVGALDIPDNSFLRGSGEIVGNVTNLGLISPGDGDADRTATLAITGSYSEIPGLPTINLFELAGAAPGEHDRLTVTGTASFSGPDSTILVSLADGFVPAYGDTFDLMDFASLTGNPTVNTSDNAPLPPGLSWDTSNFAIDGTITVVPEPGTAGAALIALGARALRHRRR